MALGSGCCTEGVWVRILHRAQIKALPAAPHTTDCPRRSLFLPCPCMLAAAILPCAPGWCSSSIAPPLHPQLARSQFFCLQPPRLPRSQPTLHLSRPPSPSAQGNPPREDLGSLDEGVRKNPGIPLPTVLFRGLQVPPLRYAHTVGWHLLRQMAPPEMHSSASQQSVRFTGLLCDPTAICELRRTSCRRDGILRHSWRKGRDPSEPFSGEASLSDGVINLAVIPWSRSQMVCKRSATVSGS